MEGLPVGHFGSVSAVTSSRGVNDPQVGDVRFVGSEKYRYIYNGGGHTATVGHAFVNSITVGTGYSLTVSSTTSIDFAVGVVKHASIPGGSYGWIVQEGMVNVQMGADHSAAVGNLLTLATDGKWCHKSCATGFLAPAQGKALSAIASAGSGLAYIFCA